MSKANGDIRIGVYVCHCGTNIAAVVDVKALAAYGATLPNVVVSREYKYLCSDPGQDLIRQDIADRKLNRIVVASCSPHLHEQTFRHALASGGLNPFYLQMVNIREQDSWVTEDKQAATRKAKDLVRAAARRVAWNESLERGRIPIHPAVMVVGGGIAGIHSALTLANAGKHVYLVEREPTIGGHMAQFDKTFPTLDCAACILTPKMSAVKSHQNITLWTYSEVTQVDGYVGNFKVKVKRWPRYVKEDLCSGCLECLKACVYKEGKFPDDFNVGLAKRKPIYISFPQAVPQVPVIDPETCIQFKSGKCKKTCIDACGERHAISLQMEGEDRGSRGRQHRPGHGIPGVRRPAHPVLRLRRVSQRVHRAGGGAPGERFRPHRRGSRSEGRPDAQDAWASCIASARATRTPTAGARASAACTRSSWPT